MATRIVTSADIDSAACGVVVALLAGTSMEAGAGVAAVLLTEPAMWDEVTSLVSALSGTRPMTDLDAQAVWRECEGVPID